MTTTLNLRDSLLKLASFSDLENKIFELKEKIESTPEDLALKVSQLKQTQNQYNEKKIALEKLETEIQELGFQIQEDQEKIKIKEARIYEIKTTKEYQAASKEISDTKRNNIEREKKLTTLHPALEELKQLLSPLETDLAELNEGVKNITQRLEEEKQLFKSELEKAENEKKQMSHLVDNGLVERYEKVLTRKRPAVSPARNGSCEECNLHLPPQLYIELQKCLEVKHCPSCMRILYIPIE